MSTLPLVLAEKEQVPSVPLCLLIDDDLGSAATVVETDALRARFLVPIVQVVSAEEARIAGVGEPFPGGFGSRVIDDDFTLRRGGRTSGRVSVRVPGERREAPRKGRLEREGFDPRRCPRRLRRIGPEP
jgi:hypothetical protein